MIHMDTREMIRKKLMPAIQEAAVILPYAAGADFLDYTAGYLALDYADWTEEEQAVLENWEQEKRRNKRGILCRTARLLFYLSNAHGLLHAAPKTCPASMLFLPEGIGERLLRAARKRDSKTQSLTVGDIAALFQNGDIYIIPGIGAKCFERLRRDIDGIYRQFYEVSPFLPSPRDEVLSSESDVYRLIRHVARARGIAVSSGEMEKAEKIFLSDKKFNTLTLERVLRNRYARGIQEGHRLNEYRLLETAEQQAESILQGIQERQNTPEDLSGCTAAALFLPYHIRAKLEEYLALHQMPNNLDILLRLLDTDSFCREMPNSHIRELEKGLTELMERSGNQNAGKAGEM